MIVGHGDDSYLYGKELRANFSSNVYPHADLSRLKAYLAGRIDCIGSYPEPAPQRLEARLAECRGVDAGNICVTAGITEAIYLIASVFGAIRTAVVQPTFSEYADACLMNGHRVVSLYQWPDADAPSREHIRLLWIGNPNNPTGEVRDKLCLSELVDANPDTIFVIDQSYEAFTRELLFTPAEAACRRNLILLHSMTKRYAIPGLRLGYISGSESLLSLVRAHRRPWSVNALAIEAGMFLADEERSHKLQGLSEYLQETERLRRRLIGLGGVDVYPTDVHFMLCCLRVGRASALKDYLAASHGLLIRDASNFPGLDSRFFRIATQSAEANAWLLDGIAQFLMLP